MEEFKSRVLAHESTDREALVSDEHGVQPESRAFAIYEVSFVILCVLAAEWLVLPVFGRNTRIGMIPIGLVFVFMSFSHKFHRETARDLGFRFDNFIEALHLLMYWMAPASVVLVSLGWILNSLRFAPARSGSSLIMAALGLFCWGLMQQYALQAIVNRRAQFVWGKGIRSVLFASFLFGVLHLPNAFLALATFLAGILWGAIYQKCPNLFALALSHCIMTTVLVSTIPAGLLHGMRVGYNYF